MQAISLTARHRGYDPAMQTGRPFKGKRTDFGLRIRKAREALGLSQAQVATKLGISQASYGAWEREEVALKPGQIEKLIKILNISIEELFGVEGPRRRGQGPSGRLRRIFEEAHKLPRHKQQHLVSVVEAFVAQHSNGNGS